MAQPWHPVTLMLKQAWWRWTGLPLFFNPGPILSCSRFNAKVSGWDSWPSTQPRDKNVSSSVATFGQTVFRVYFFWVAQYGRREVQTPAKTRLLTVVTLSRFNHGPQLMGFTFLWDGFSFGNEVDLVFLTGLFGRLNYIINCHIYCWDKVSAQKIKLPITFPSKWLTNLQATPLPDRKDGGISDTKIDLEEQNLIICYRQLPTHLFRKQAFAASAPSKFKIPIYLVFLDVEKEFVLPSWQ